MRNAIAAYICAAYLSVTIVIGAAFAFAPNTFSDKMVNWATAPATLWGILTVAVGFIVYLITTEK